MDPGLTIHKGTSPFIHIGQITNCYIDVIPTQLKQTHLDTLIPEEGKPSAFALATEGDNMLKP
jgi:hypothetical protein